MKIRFSRRFDMAYDKLSSEEKEAVQKALDILAVNLRHPGLRVRKMATEEDIWECSPSRRLRVTFHIEGESILLRAVGGHEILKRP